ncbi:hypothetical protein SKAU_G00143370 [Synaphobranchus kaupii]|uniref:Uncharacterized protein n=1 Tax=Synaphobranchus kaupii TaxID=118154 RepID=A0A9Q1FTB8_SYNKA|nr:hypothetical protein SKAU_G00143370 [Synaphobranchus kaupii]
MLNTATRLAAPPRPPRSPGPISQGSPLRSSSPRHPPVGGSRRSAQPARPQTGARTPAHKRSTSHKHTEATGNGRQKPKPIDKSSQPRPFFSTADPIWRMKIKHTMAVLGPVCGSAWGTRGRTADFRGWEPRCSGGPGSPRPGCERAHASPVLPDPGLHLPPARPPLPSARAPRRLLLIRPGSGLVKESSGAEREPSAHGRPRGRRAIRRAFQPRPDLQHDFKAGRAADSPV